MSSFFKVGLGLLGLFITANGQGYPSDGVGIVIGGSGGGVTMEAVTATGTCQGANAIPALPTAPSGSIVGWSMEYVDGSLWLCGGSNLNDQADCYSLASGAYWIQEVPMLLARQNAASFVTPSGDFVIMGGYSNRAGYIDEVEIKYANQGLWERKIEWTLPDGMFDHCAQAINDTHFIVTGGKVYQSDYLTATRILDTTTNTWTEVEPMPEPGRAEHKCINWSINGEPGLLVTGGCYERCLYHLDETLFFSYTTQSWQTLGNMVEPRNGHGMFLMEGVPAVVAGYYDQELESVEVLNGTEWVNQPFQLTAGRNYFGCPTYVPSSFVSC